MTGTVAEGSTVLLDVNGDKRSFAVVKSNSKVKIGKVQCSMAPLVGAPYGAVFELVGSALERVSAEEAVTLQAQAQEEEDEDQAPPGSLEGRDNRSLVDDNKAQVLSQADIATMRQSGATGSEIVEKLVKGSATFGTKTAFSQEKYLRRKGKKYIVRVTVRRPTARSVCEAYFADKPFKTGHMRVDALALLLALGNVRATAHVLVLESCGGLLTGAIAERMGGHGVVCSTHATPKPPSIDIARLFNLLPEAQRSVVRVPVAELVRLQKESSNATGEKTDNLKLEAQPLEAAVQDSNGAPSPTAAAVDDIDANEERMDADIPGQVDGEMEAQGNGEHGAGGSPPFRSGRGGTLGRRPTDEERAQWRDHGFTSLIVACASLQPAATADQLLPLLAQSAPFAFYSPYLQPLAECMHYLQKSRNAVNLQISEPWLREHQVLPQRSHPHMTMSATGGYILSGIAVSSKSRI
eukprot:jgi/Chlat1/2316/Chrsp17S00172